MSQPRPRYEPPKPLLKLPPKEVLACVVTVSLLTIILLPVFRQAQDMGRQASCSSNLRSRSNALLQYATDNDGNLPPASQWQTVSSNYLKEEKGSCPSLSHSVPSVLGYAMDSRLSSRSLEKIGAPHETRVLLYESSNLTPNANDPGISFTVRHGYASIAFVDGHVKMYEQEPGEQLVRKGILAP
ncbi:hypothetical protein [Armatimonas sp.]|uniref:hypothetical protein n=1 Tax=Armatimonas sp. TaxID=1872638 RepID=UPI003753E51C